MFGRRFLLTRVVLAVLALAFMSQAASARQSEITVEGRLTPTTEAGGWLIVSDAGKYLILNSREFQSKPWFRKGTNVEATGEGRQDAVTIYQEGVPFRVSTMRPVRGGTQTGDTQTGGSQTGGSQMGSSQTGGRPTPVTGRGGGVTRVVVMGDATVQSQPDTAILTVAVVTLNASASEAQSENASKTDAVISAVKAAAGAGAEVKTSGYSLQPQYVYKEGTVPTITSYIARNSVSVTTGALSRVGATIDAASRAGANSVDGLYFTLRHDEQPRNKALADATREAAAKARVIAETLGGRVVRIVEVQEAGASRPVPIYQYGALEKVSVTTQTPIEPGSLEIRAQVQLVAEIEEKE
jgi:uncharacterized protein YggE